MGDRDERKAAYHGRNSQGAQRGLSFAGAYLKYGFHEDGFTSGLRAVLSVPGVMLGTAGDEKADGRGVGHGNGHAHGGGALRLPFEVRDPDRSLGAVWPARLFDVLEWTGLRRAAGGLLSVVVGWLLAFFGRVFDLRHLQ